MIHYIKDNPRRLWLKRANPDLFRIHQQTPISGTACTTLGNMFLAESPLLEALHCSRSLTLAEVDTLHNDCLTKATNGTVFVSPAISEGEKKICRALREAGFPLIILLNEGFPSHLLITISWHCDSGYFINRTASCHETASQLLVFR